MHQVGGDNVKTSKVLAVIVACLPAASLVPSQALFSAGLASVEELASTKIDGAIAYVPVEGDGSENAGWTDAADVSGDAAEDPEETIPECPPDDSQAELVESVLAEQESDDSVILDESVDTQSITYEDDAILATATAPVGVLPVGTSLSVMEVLPTDADTADAYKKSLKTVLGMITASIWLSLPTARTT